MKSELVFTIDTDNCVHIDARKCGMEFNSVAHVFQYESENPMLHLTQLLGCRAVQHILDFVKERPALTVGVQHVREYRD